MQYLYLIRCNEFYKIGVANDVEARLAALQTGNPYTLELAGCYGFPNADIVEKTLHQKFFQQKVRGEWFILTAKLVKDFSVLCSMLGGSEQSAGISVTEEDVRQAEEMQETVLTANEGARWDFAKMFSEGWRIEAQRRRTGRTAGLEYWQWRRGSGNSRKAMYGGRIADLPYPPSEMKKHYEK